MRELAATADTDPGYVSRLLGMLDREAIVDRTTRGRVERIDWRKLLLRWSEEAPLESRTTASTYSRLVWGWPHDDAAGCLLPRVVVGILDEPLASGSGDLYCGIGPDGRSYLVPSGSLAMALGLPRCLDDAPLSAPDC